MYVHLKHTSAETLQATSTFKQDRYDYGEKCKNVYVTLLRI